jgi:hypothetical protein
MAATRPIAIERRATFLQTVASTLQRCGEIGPVSCIVPSSRRSASELAARAQLPVLCRQPALTPSRD